MLMRLLAIAIVALLSLIVPMTQARAALCPPGCGTVGTGSAECTVCDGGNPNEPDPDNPGKSPGQLPLCPPSKKALPEDEDHPDGWVLTPCKEGSVTLMFWVPAADVDPRAIATSILNSMNLRAIEIGMVPDPGLRGAVGLPVWLWVDGADRHTWGPYTISAGGVSMTARATKVVWKMGDGASVTCGKGKEYRDAYEVADSPVCGHRYTQQGRYTVRATAYWEAAWSGYGQSGVIAFPLTSSRSVEIGEIQVLVKP